MPVADPDVVRRGAPVPVPTSAVRLSEYEGKVASAGFFATSVVSELTAPRAVVEATDNALMDVPEESF